MISLCNFALDNFIEGIEWLKNQNVILAERTDNGFIPPDKIIVEHFHKKELKIIPFEKLNFESQKRISIVLKTGEPAFVIYYEKPIFLSPEQVEIKVGY